MNDMRYVVLEKPIGQTPLEAIQAWKAENPAYATIPASYAGRLDPMASGKLLVLLGEECKRQHKYTKLDKEYVVEIVLDVGSDTGDVLGIASYAANITIPSATLVREVLKNERGTHVRPYPIFSSKTVAGKPLFLYALEGTLDTITIPTHPETLYSLSCIDSYTLSKKELRERVNSILARTPINTEPSKVLGADFRIQNVQSSWDAVFREIPDRSFTVLRISVACASGSYMRSLAGRVGASLGTRGLALSIHRTKIGSYLPYFHMWTRLFR